MKEDFFLENPGTGRAARKNRDDVMIAAVTPHGAGLPAAVIANRGKSLISHQLTLNEQRKHIPGPTFLIKRSKLSTLKFER